MNPQIAAMAVTGSVLAAAGQVSFKCGAAGREALAQFANPWILGGLLLYAAGTTLWVLALARVPLTTLYPFAALTYVLVNVFAVSFLGERISMQGAAGTGLVLLGLFLVANANPVR